MPVCHFLEVARECNVSGAAIHQRIQKTYQPRGVIKGSEFIVDNTKVGYETCAYMGFVPQISRAVSKRYGGSEGYRKVVECHYTTGAI